MEALRKLVFDGIEAECEKSGIVYRIPKGEYGKINMFRYAYMCPNCKRIHTIPGRKIKLVRYYENITNGTKKTES